MTSKLKFAIPFVFLVMLFGLLWAELSANRSNTYSSGIVGEKLPAFSVPNLSGTSKLTQEDLKGHISLLNFFASWCSACQIEHDMLMKISNDYHILVYGIAFRDKPDDTRNMLNNKGNPYAKVGYDEEGEVGVDFGIYATPETFVIGPNGDILYKQIGVINQLTWDEVILPIIKTYQTS